MKDLKIFARTIDPKAQQQIYTLLSQKAFENCKVRIMPDVHAGAGCVIGFTANLGDKVIPNIVGVDIGCGMYVAELGKIDIDFEKLDNVIRKYIPYGMNVHTGGDEKEQRFWDMRMGRLKCADKLKNRDWLTHSLGTLGGGNHFIEIDEDENGSKFLVIHTGSRNLGKQVAEIYQDLAIKNCRAISEDRRKEVIAALKAQGRSAEISEALDALKKEAPAIPDELCYLEGKQREDYLEDMRACQGFAKFNRARIASEICWHMKFPVIDCFHTVHNYIDDDGMVRKGAISAKAGEKLLIPINMRDGCILGTGLGNYDWNFSAPHGAGRLMSRSAAREGITLEEYQESMKSVYTTTVGASTLDEAPQAYKPMAEILECIQDTVRVDRILKPVYNFKG